MVPITTYISPNGQPTTKANGPAMRILVATLEGICTLGRDHPGAAWEVIDRTLLDQHVGALL